MLPKFEPEQPVAGGEEESSSATAVSREELLEHIRAAGLRSWSFGPGEHESDFRAARLRDLGRGGDDAAFLLEAAEQAQQPVEHG